MKFEVLSDGGRIDSFLIDKLSKSRSKIQSLIKSGNVLVNSIPVKASYVVRCGDIVSVNDII